MQIAYFQFILHRNEACSPFCRNFKSGEKTGIVGIFFSYQKAPTSTKSELKWLKHQKLTPRDAREERQRSMIIQVHSSSVFASRFSIGRTFPNYLWTQVLDTLYYTACFVMFCLHNTHNPKPQKKKISVGPNCQPFLICHASNNFWTPY